MRHHPDQLHKNLKIIAFGPITPLWEISNQLTPKVGGDAVFTEIVVTNFNIKLSIVAKAWKQPKNFNTVEIVSMTSKEKEQTSQEKKKHSH